MGPKKRDREGGGEVSSAGDVKQSKTSDGNQVLADHELFLQAFEKPTQIYRYLRTRHLLSPIFLHRSLSYMRGRMAGRDNRKRSTFKVDELLASRQQERQRNETSGRSKFMTLTFLGFYDNTAGAGAGRDEEPVRVETLLLQIGHKKRKDVSSPIMQMSFGTCEVALNPKEDDDDESQPLAPTVSIGTEDLSLRSGSAHQGNSYVLLLRVQPPQTNAEPASKRRKISEDLPTTSRLFGAELVVYDRHSRCLLVDGDYELALQQLSASGNGSPTDRRVASGSPLPPSQQTASWNTMDGVAPAPATISDQGPTLKFRLQWADQPIKPLVDRPKPYAAEVTRPERSSRSASNGLRAAAKAASRASAPEPTKKKEEKVCVRYQFLYHSNRRQQTEARYDLHCPWCSLHCRQLPSLLKHLRLCHSRFTFSHSTSGSASADSAPSTAASGESAAAAAEQQYVRIDVSVNEAYDGTYTGNPHDLIAQPAGSASGKTGGAAFGRQGPTRRTPVTAMLIWRPRRLRAPAAAGGYDPFSLDDGDAYEVCDTQRPFITGHNRLYHHTSTCLPIQAKELDVDSEGEGDPEWLRTKTCMMIDEFSDVNEGEKELMKLWNLHVLRHNYVGDCQMATALQMFLDEHGEELMRRNLYRNFLLHLCNLYDFGVVTPAVVLRTIGALQRLLQRDKELHKALTDAWISQLSSASD